MAKASGGTRGGTKGGGERPKRTPYSKQNRKKRKLEADIASPYHYKKVLK